MKTTKLTKEQMMDNVCRRFGLENEWVIAFCSACESSLYPDKIMEVLYDCKMKNADEGIDDENFGRGVNAHTPPPVRMKPKATKFESKIKK